eukprot:GHVU01008744.1.p2 GENE.GHVU01008744.1~~GHVU01008744.1.p2  ORF type:complete len:192 (+),score=20.30 GHVU01008744.1:681-1256(+)
MYNDESLEGAARAVAGGYHDALAKVETAFMTAFWERLLEHINVASIALQKPSQTLTGAVTIYTKLVERVRLVRDDFDELEAEAYELCGSTDYVERRQAAAERNRHRGGAPPARLSGRQRFRTEGFVRVMDDLQTFLGDRLDGYRDTARVWAFLERLPECKDEELRGAADNLRQACPSDFSESLCEELILLS